MQRKILAAWEDWPDRLDPYEGARDTLLLLTPVLRDAEWIEGGQLSPKGRDLLDRARKAGVFGPTADDLPEDRDDSEDIHWATSERPPERLDDVTPEDIKQ